MKPTVRQVDFDPPAGSRDAKPGVIVVDPISAVAIAAATVFASKVIEGAGGEAGKALTGAPGRLVDWIRRRGAEDSKTDAAVTLAEAKPGDERRISQLAEALAARAVADPGFATELLALLEATRDVRTLRIGGAHIGRISGHTKVTQIGRDQINMRRDQKR